MKGKLPTKRSINLVLVDENKINPLTAILGVLLIVVLAGAFSKFLVIDRLNAYAQSRPGWSLAPSNYEGVRVNLDESHGNGWFLLRLSLHDPLLPLNIESNELGGAKKIAGELAEFLKDFDKLDAVKLLEFAK